MFQKLVHSIYLDFVLKAVGILIVAITVWKGVHGWPPSLGIIIGFGLWYVGMRFDKIYRQ